MNSIFYRLDLEKQEELGAGARETHGAANQNRVAPSKTKKFLKSNSFFCAIIVTFGHSGL